MPQRRQWLPTPVFLPGEYHGQRSPVGYSPWDHKESDMAEQLTEEYRVGRISRRQFFFFFFPNWSVVDLWCCVNFCCTAKWFSYTHIYILKIFFSIMVYHREDSFCFTQKPVFLSFYFIHLIHNSLYLLTPTSQSISLPWPSQVLFSIGKIIFIINM